LLVLLQSLFFLCNPLWPRGMASAGGVPRYS
jgi:hypothetical protein